MRLADSKYIGVSMYTYDSDYNYAIDYACCRKNFCT